MIQWFQAYVIAVQKKGYMDLQEVAGENSEPSYGATLQKDSSCALPCSWAESDPSLFLIRGETYLRDHQKVVTNYRFVPTRI